MLRIPKREIQLLLLFATLYATLSVSLPKWSRDVISSLWIASGRSGPLHFDLSYNMSPFVSLPLPPLHSLVLVLVLVALLHRCTSSSRSSSFQNRFAMLSAGADAPWPDGAPAALIYIIADVQYAMPDKTPYKYYYFACFSFQIV